MTGRYSDKKRLILDLSAPHDSKNHYSVHELIDKDMRSMANITVDDAIRTIREYGNGANMCKLDIKRAFKNLPTRNDQ